MIGQKYRNLHFISLQSVTSLFIQIKIRPICLKYWNILNNVFRFLCYHCFCVLFARRKKRNNICVRSVIIKRKPHFMYLTIRCLETIQSLPHPECLFQRTLNNIWIVPPKDANLYVFLTGNEENIHSLLVALFTLLWIYNCEWRSAYPQGLFWGTLHAILIRTKI